jgi:2-methylcitrate dehydratase PrpD
MTMSTPITVTGALAQHAAGLDLTAVPEDVARHGRRLFTDTVGVLIAASQTAPVTLLAGSPVFAGERGRSTVIGHSRDQPVDRAAFINGVSGHHIELDDSHSPSQTHPGAVLVPATLAAAELSGASGADVLAGFLAGYDVIGRFCSAADVESIYERGFHPTSVAGTLAAAAAAGRVLRLGPDAMTVALGLAASQSCGLLTWEDDSTHLAKSFQTGVAARNGVHAAMVAWAGYGGAMDALGGRYNATRAFGGQFGDPSLIDRDLGTRFDIMATELKRHASCRQTHAAVDAMLLLLEDTRLPTASIERVEIELARSSTKWVGGNPLWTHNVEFVVSLAAHEGQVLPGHFEKRWTENPAIRSLAGRTTVLGNEDLESRFPAAKGAIVRIWTAHGMHERTVHHPLGHPDNPMSDEQLRAKFDALASNLLTPDRSALLHARLESLDTLSDVESLLELLTPIPS